MENGNAHMETRLNRSIYRPAGVKASAGIADGSNGYNPQALKPLFMFRSVRAAFQAGASSRKN